MSLTVAIIGEMWEASFARATARSLAGWLPQDAEIVVPFELGRAVIDVCPRQPLVLPPAPPGFQSYKRVREQTLKQLGDDHQGVLLLFAGTSPANDQPIERLGSPFTFERVVEWVPPYGGGPLTVIHFERSHHSPPVNPEHNVTSTGSLDLWALDAGDNYFQALVKIADSSGPPLWPQYGCHQPVFAYNTNEFYEPSVDTHDDYFILGSGLLGLRMVIESQPRNGARVIVYDINPDQLLWTRFVLENAGDMPEFDRLIQVFGSKYPHVEIRSVLPHESQNAYRQQDWYRRNHKLISKIVSNLKWEFIQCDLLTNPLPVFNRLLPLRSLFFMYLDLFVVWHIDGETPWVENYAGMASSLENIVRERTGSYVTFLPGRHSASFQLQPTSPFVACGGDSSCT